MSETVKLHFGKKVEHYDKKQSGEQIASSQKTEAVPTGIQTDAPVANVNVHLDARIGKPNYSSVGVGVSLTMPCPTDKVDETFEAVKLWCEERMSEMMKEVS
jgi:hypothetical protein